MATNIKITALSDITSANMTYNDLVAVVDMNGTPETKKSSVQLLGNLILGGAGGSNFVNAAIATLAGDVTNAAQANITSVGTLTALSVTANVAAGNVNATTAITAAYFSGDGANLTNLPSGANSTAIANGTSNVHIPASAGNVNTSVGGTANVLVITATGANVAGTLNTSGIVTGIGSGLSAIVGANVSGEVTNAATANAVALANVSGAGNIASINIDGSASTVLYGNGVFAAAGAGSNSAAIANGTSNINIATADGSATIGIGGVADIVTVSGTAVTVVGGVAATYVSGDGANLAAIAGANVTGAVPFATTANAVAGANVSGEVTFAATANAVAYANVSGTPALGNISTINIDGAAGNVLYGNGAFAPVSSTTAQTVTTAAQPNITSTGTLTSLTVTGALGVTTGLITGDGGGISNIAVGNLVGTINLATFAGTANAVAGANVSGEVTFAATANAVAGANVSGTVALATTAGTVTTAAQPNITSTGTLTSLTVSGALDVLAGTLTADTLTTGASGTAGVITGNWSLSSGSRLSATYADLAEYYKGEKAYEAGTVVCFGGSAEVHISEEKCSRRVAGVVSTNPAYLMNSTCSGIPVAVALQGRVPTKVTGTCEKGDVMVSDGLGGATAWYHVATQMLPGVVIGKSIVDKDTTEMSTIEIAVGRL